MSLTFVPADSGDTFVNPDHVIQARFHAGRNDLRIQLLDCETWLLVDGNLYDLQPVLARLGYIAHTLTPDRVPA